MIVVGKGFPNHGSVLSAYGDLCFGSPHGAIASCFPSSIDTSLIVPYRAT